MTQLLAPLLVVSAVSVALGWLPYLRLRNQLIRNGKVLGEVRTSVDESNRSLAEYIRSRNVKTTAHEMQQEKVQTDVRLLEEKYRALETSTREQKATLDSIRNQLREANMRGKELERYALTYLIVRKNI